MKDSLISVIIPVYNVEPYLRQCLDSVLAQTYTSYEVILVDDGSTDGSGTICDEYTEKDNRFRVIHQKNGGLSIGRNTGFDVAHGEYVYFMDSDDWIESETLQKLIEKAKAAEADFVFFDGRSFEDSEKGYDIKQGYTRKKEYPMGNGIEVFDDLQENGDFKSAIPTYLWKKSFIIENHLQFYPGILYEDMIFAFAAFCGAKYVVHYHEGLYQRRVRAESITTSKPKAKNFNSACTAFEEVVRIARENNYLTRPSVIRYVARCAMRPIDLYAQLSPADKQVCKDKYRQVIHEIRAAKGYGNKALYWRTYGKLLWAAAKAKEKITRRSK